MKTFIYEISPLSYKLLRLDPIDERVCVRETAGETDKVDRGSDNGPLMGLFNFIHPLKLQFCVWLGLIKSAKPPKLGRLKALNRAFNGLNLYK